MHVALVFPNSDYRLYAIRSALFGALPPIHFLVVAFSCSTGSALLARVVSLFSCVEGRDALCGCWCNSRIAAAFLMQVLGGGWLRDVCVIVWCAVLFCACVCCVRLYFWYIIYLDASTYRKNGVFEYVDFLFRLKIIVFCVRLFVFVSKQSVVFLSPSSRSY